MRAATTSVVVPAKAGTHNHRPGCFARCRPSPHEIITVCGYGSRVALRLPGTTEDKMSPDLAYILSLALRMAVAAAFVVTTSIIAERARDLRPALLQ